MEVYTVQWRDGTEPWGWESLLLFTDLDDARLMFEDMVERNGNLWVDQASLAWALSHLRLVKIEVRSGYSAGMLSSTWGVEEGELGITVIETGDERLKKVEA